MDIKRVTANAEATAFDHYGYKGGFRVASEHGGQGWCHGHAEALEQKTGQNAAASEAAE
jgi:hypothetical protein